MNPNIDLPSVGARLGVYRAAFESEHAQAFYAMRALQPVHLTTGSDAHAPAV
jgi:hypothetical protein